LKIKKTLKIFIKEEKKGLAFFTVVKANSSNLDFKPLNCYQKTTKKIINENLLDLTEIPKIK
jgi:hypothetical protein